MPIIVIDPGHGGENRGGEYGEFVENCSAGYERASGKI